MISSHLHRNVNIGTRAASAIVSAVSLVFFVLIFFKVFNPNFPAVQPSYAILPVAALSTSVFWNSISLITIFFLDFPRFFYPAGDLVAFLVIVIPTSIGFAHDDAQYLSNGQYISYDNDSWLKQAIIAGSFAVLAAIIQLLLIVWAFLAPTGAQKQNQGPPPYPETEYVNEKEDVKEKDEKEMEVDWQSVSSFQIETKNAKEAHSTAV